MDEVDPPPPPYEAVHSVLGPGEEHDSDVSLEAAERAMLQPLRLRLRIPARPKPQAVLNISSSDTEPESGPQVLRPEAAMPLSIPKASKKKKKKRKAPVAVDSQGDSTSDGVTESAPKDKRRRGSPSREDVESVKADVVGAECVIQVEQAPVRVAKGKGTHKFVKQDPLRFGPIDIHTTMVWDSFLDLIAGACETTRGCLNTSSLTWRWSKPGNSPIMLLSSEVAFLSLRKKLGPKKLTIIVGMNPPRMPDNVRAPWVGSASGVHTNDTSAWTSLIQPPPGLEDDGETGKNNSKVWCGLYLVKVCVTMLGVEAKLDNGLEEIVGELEAKYPVGVCPDHPDK
ncbi:hypothetical protein K439DRAFT_1634908 [Ramaria rubella]|nr:hypothetical protein K439DRAFT_1634908 [Ramaria rubella]